jgi:hypothetical protein
MTRCAGLLWDTPLVFKRLVEDSGVTCELVTPQLLAAPFFRQSFVTLIVPTGFANRKYSSLLPALKAVSSRINTFLEKGGRMLVYGAGDDRPDSYEWLPFTVSYRQEYASCKLAAEGEGDRMKLLEGFENGKVDCDGWFPEHDGETLLACDGRAVCIRVEVGNGVVFLTSIHEYPSRCFLSSFCEAGHETLF